MPIASRYNKVSSGDHQNSICSMTIVYNNGRSKIINGVFLLCDVVVAPRAEFEDAQSVLIANDSGTGKTKHLAGSPFIISDTGDLVAFELEKPLPCAPAIFGGISKKFQGGSLVYNGINYIVQSGLEIDGRDMVSAQYPKFLSLRDLSSGHIGSPVFDTGGLLRTIMTRASHEDPKTFYAPTPTESLRFFRQVIDHFCQDQNGLVP